MFSATLRSATAKAALADLYWTPQSKLGTASDNQPSSMADRMSHFAVQQINKNSPC
jgi:hypothetical protein